MTSRSAMTRGPLPPSVYWRRRLLVLALGATLVFVIADLLNGASDGKDDQPVAEQAAAPTASQTVTVRTGTARAHRRQRSLYGPSQPPTVLAQPSGPCPAADVILTPQVEHGVAGQDNTIGLQLQTKRTEACYFTVSRSSVAVKILDGTTVEWTTQDCPRAIPQRRVVVRRAIATVVPMAWDTHRSGEGCRRGMPPLMPGDYTAVGAALGGEPSESSFDLAAPGTRTVTVTPDPKPSDSATDSSDSASPRDSSTTPSSSRTPRAAASSTTGEPRR